MRMIAPLLFALCIAGGCEEATERPSPGDTATAGTTTAPATTPDSGARATGGVNAP